MKPPYEVETDFKLNFYIKGPGSYDYGGGHLYPKARFKTKEEAEKCVKFMNLAFEEGYKKFKYTLKNLIIEEDW